MFDSDDFDFHVRPGSAHVCHFVLFRGREVLQIEWMRGKDRRRGDRLDVCIDNRNRERQACSREGMLVHGS